MTTTDFALERLVVGLAVSIVFSLGGWYARALTRNGAITAVVVGTAIIVGVSWPGAVVLGAFFLSSSALSKLSHKNDVTPKGSRRDEKQVLANGVVAAIAALSALVLDEFLAYGMVSGALAAATADTWATEVGSKSRRTPRFLLSRRGAIAGESGAVTMIGTLGSVLGAAFIGIVATISGRFVYSSIEAIALLFVVPVAGLAGSIIDSLLGELLQEKRWCPACDLPSEARVHRCGTETVAMGGIRWVDNDTVNLFCTITGALIGTVVYFSMI